MGKCVAPGGRKTTKRNFAMSYHVTERRDEIKRPPEKRSRGKREWGTRSLVSRIKHIDASREKECPAQS